jgi:nucleoside-diphosphate kinase
MNQQTFAMIKSGAVSRGNTDAIVEKIKANGLTVSCIQEEKLTREKASLFYAEHAGRPYFEGLLNSVTDPDYGVILMILEGDNAISKWRNLLGATDPSKAAPGTIRQEFGKGMPDNAAHGSDSLESAEREISIMFPNLIYRNSAF